MSTRKPYPSHGNDEQWALVAQYLALVQAEAPQRQYPLREIFNGLRWIVRTGTPWCMMPHDLPPWWMVYRQTRRWLRGGIECQIVTDLRALLRLAQGRGSDPTGVAVDSRTRPSAPESCGRAIYDRHKRRKGSKIHMAVDTLGQSLPMHMTPANE